MAEVIHLKESDLRAQKQELQDELQRATFLLGEPDPYSLLREAADLIEEQHRHVNDDGQRCSVCGYDAYGKRLDNYSPRATYTADWNPGWPCPSEQLRRRIEEVLDA